MGEIKKEERKNQMSNALTTEQLVEWLRDQASKCTLEVCDYCANLTAAADAVEQAATLRTERDALALRVEQMREALRLYANHHGSTLGKHPEGCDGSQEDLEAIMIDRKVNDALSRYTLPAAVAEVAEMRSKAMRFDTVLPILQSAPELNMSNYTEHEVSELNNAMIQAYLAAKEANDASK